jgi:hypothetical protein
VPQAVIKEKPSVRSDASEGEPLLLTTINYKINLSIRSPPIFAKLGSIFLTIYILIKKTGNNAGFVIYYIT